MLIQQLLCAVLLWQTPSFIEQSIASANESIAKEPSKPDGYNDLAMAMVRKHRETGDPAFLLSAESAIRKSLALQNANFEGRRARVALRLRQHRYEDALEEAEALRKLRPDDNPLYGYISEAEIGIGNYPEAEKAVQRMLDLRNVNGPGFEYGAIVREMIGFPDAAFEWWNSALHLVSDRDREERAFILTQMGRIHRETGKYDLGLQAVEQALELEPEYPMALLERARLRLDRQEPRLAVDSLLVLTKKRDDLEALYWLGFAQEKAGDHDAAQVTEAKFERAALAASNEPLNANTLLIRYLAENGKPGQAVDLAERALLHRHDLFLRQSYAIALFRARRGTEALAQIRQAIEPGFLDQSLFFDAGTIAKQLGQNELAVKYMKRAFEVNVNGPYSGEILNQITPGKSLLPN